MWDGLQKHKQKRKMKQNKGTTKVDVEINKGKNMKSRELESRK